MVWFVFVPKAHTPFQFAPIYIPGEFGIRMEDCWHMTGQGPQLFTPLAKSIDEPI